MAIPKIVTPTYECELPSTKQKIKYRPFLVKEEKVLLVALESDDDNAIQCYYVRTYALLWDYW